MDSEKVQLSGQIWLELRDEKGNVKDSQHIKNTIVTVGKNYLASWLAADAQAGKFMQYIGLGTGTTAANASDTGLETPLATRTAGTLTSNNNVWQNVATFGPGVNTGAISEAGLFSAASSGTMFAHQVFGVKNKDAGDTLSVTWQLTIS